jgi:hypothetical protein
MVLMVIILHPTFVKVKTTTNFFNINLNQMKKLLLKKLSAFIVTAILFSVSANAQFVYTDVIPDFSESCTTTCSKTDSVDINNDGIFDLKLVIAKSGANGSVKATPLNGSAILRAAGLPVKLFRNDSINPTSNWSNTANQTLRSVSLSGPIGQGNFTYSGTWGPSIDGFLGIRIASGSETNYGWIRMNIAVSTQSISYTYKEFAYNSVSDQAILAGQTTDTVIVGPIVYIPDAVFKSRLVNNAAINIDIDREIQVTEAAAFTGQLNISTGGSNSPISDLTGIEAFTALTYLNCIGNNLTSLDFSGNTALTFLNCGYNDLTSLNISANAALETLYSQNNLLTSIDVSANNALALLNISHNSLTSIDLSSNFNLGAFYCYNNQLTDLELSANTVLETLYCHNNQLTSLNFPNSVDYLECQYNQLTNLDVSANAALWRLICNNNQLTSLDVSANTALVTLYCNHNQITSLDVSDITVMVSLLCNNNQLTSLNVKNGNNINFNAFDARNNPNLFCIEVDNAAYSNVNWSNGKDVTAIYSNACLVTSAPEIGNLAGLQIFPNPAHDHFTIDFDGDIRNAEVNIFDMTGKIIYSDIASSLSQLVVNTGDFSEGIYMVQIQAEGFIATKKLVIEK